MFNFAKQLTVKVAALLLLVGQPLVTAVGIDCISVNPADVTQTKKAAVDISKCETLLATKLKRALQPFVEHPGQTVSMKRGEKIFDTLNDVIKKYGRRSCRRPGGSFFTAPWRPTEDRNKDIGFDKVAYKYAFGESLIQLSRLSDADLLSLAKFAGKDRLLMFEQLNNHHGFTLYLILYVIKLRDQARQGELFTATEAQKFVDVRWPQYRRFHGEVFWKGDVRVLIREALEECAVAAAQQCASESSKGATISRVAK